MLHFVQHDSEWMISEVQTDISLPYIMSNKNDTTLYVGFTNDIERRIKEHKSGLTKGFTQRYNCDKLVYFETYSDVNQALDREKQIKKWRREKKDLLIKTLNPDLKDLSDGFLDSLRSLEMTDYGKEEL